MSRAWLAVQTGEVFGLGGVEHAQVGGPLLGLGDEARAVGGGGHAVEDDAGRRAEPGAGLDAHPGFGDDAEDALAADNHAVGGRAGAAAGESAGFPHAGGGYHAHGLNEVVDVGVVGGVVSAAAGGNPAAQGGELEALGEVAQGVAVGTELRFQGRAENAGLDAGGAGSVVDFQHLVQVGQVDGYYGVGWRGFDAGDDGAAAAVGDGDDVGVGAPVEDGYQLGFSAGVGDNVGRVGKVAVEAADAVAEAAAIGVGGAVVVVGGAELGDEGMGQDARRTEVEVGVGGRLGRREGCAVTLVDAPGHGVVVGGSRLAVFVAPGPETAAGHAITPVWG